MFADDTNLFLTGKSLADVEEQINQEFIIISYWMVPIQPTIPEPNKNIIFNFW